MKTAFFTKVQKQAARNATHGYQRLFSLPESPQRQAFTAATSHCHTKQTRTQIHSLFTISSLFSNPIPLHPTMCSQLPPSPDSSHFHAWQESESQPETLRPEKKCPFTLLDWQRLRLFLSAHRSYHHSNLTEYEFTLSCVMLQRFSPLLAVRTTQRKRHEHAEIHYHTQMQKHTRLRHPDRVSRPFVPLLLLQGE